MNTKETTSLLELAKKMAEKAIVVTENQGGYRAGECVFCGETGWINVAKGASNGINHKKDCPTQSTLLI